MMHSNGYKRASRSSPARVLIASLVLLGIAVLLLVLSIVESRPAFLFRGRNTFVLEGNGPAACAAAGNGLAAATAEHIQLFSARGKCVAEKAVSLTEPGCAGSALLSVFYDVGAPGVTALYPDGTVREADTAGPVLLADVNETGLVAVLLERSGYKGGVMVYDTDLTPLFRWDAGSGYPTVVRLSPDDQLCVCCLSEAGSTFHFFRIDREDELAAFTLPGEIVLDLGYLSDGTVAAVTEDRLALVASDGTLAAQLPLDGRHPGAWYLRGRFAAVAAVTGLDGGSEELITLDSEGRILGRRSAPWSITALSGAGDQLLVLYTGRESTLYTSALEELVSCQPPEDCTRVFLSGDGRAIYGGGQRAVQVDFTR